MTGEVETNGSATIDRDYRRSHVTADAARRYDALYSPGTYEDWVWDLEKAHLTRLVRKHVLSRAPKTRLLDFACGTGRILAFLEPLMTDATGVDVSAAMLALTGQRVSKARLLCGDITKEDILPAGGFDLVTAFRFFLNADLALRGETLKAIRRVLADEGILIANIHGNLWSLHLVPYLFRRYLLRREISAVPIREMKRLLARHGFDVIEIAGQAWCTRRLYGFLGRLWCDRIERIFSKIPLLANLAVNLMIVCRRVECR